jgi:hypothetical protein
MQLGVTILIGAMSVIGSFIIREAMIQTNQLDYGMR